MFPHQLNRGNSIFSAYPLLPQGVVGISRENGSKKATKYYLPLGMLHTPASGGRRGMISVLGQLPSLAVSFLDLIISHPHNHQLCAYTISKHLHILEMEDNDR